MKAAPIDDEDQYENPDWPDISTAELEYEWEDSSTLDGTGTSTLDSSTSEFDFLGSDELDIACTDVLDDSAFEAAEEECLRGSPAPNPSQQSGQRGKAAFVAWVVFRGHEQGIFQTWYVNLREFVLSHDS